MAVDIKISGVTVSALDDYMITESVGNISSSSITVHVTSGVPQPMQKVEFYIGAVKYFTGLIEDVSSPTWNSKHTIADYDLSITSIETILNNRRVTGSWKNKLAHEIVSDLITDYLLDEGLTAGSISVTAKSYDNYNCEGTRLSEVLDELARDTGASYYINSSLAFNFVIPADYPTVTVPTDINEISENIEANDLVTVQTVIGAQKETEEQAESILSWTGTYWDLQFQVTTITGMTINGEIAQHGIKDIDIDPSITFWYEVGSRRITLNPSATFIPDDGDLVACLYKGYLNISATETNDTLIAQLQALNGTSGRIEAVHNDESILTFTDAYNKAVELLAKSGEVTKTVTLKTHSLTASALNNKWVLNLTDAKISGTYYVIARTITRFANEFECTVTLKNKSADLRPGSSLYKSTKSTNTIVNTSTTKPDTVADCAAVARENYIELSCNKVAQELNNTLKWYRWEIKKSIAGDWSGASIVYSTTNSAQYNFDRNIDGYPEASDLAGWSVRVMAVDIYGNDADNYSNVTGIVTTTYGTWEGYAPILSPIISHRNIIINITAPAQAQNRTRYGNKRYRISIQKPIEGYDDTIWYKPASGENPYTDEDNWKAIDQTTNYSEVVNTWQQVVPFTGQDAGNPIDRAYIYRVTRINEKGSGTPATVTTIAMANNVRDIVANAITTNKLADGAVVADKIAASTITADKMYVPMLSAISVNLGTITGGMLKSTNNDYNLWAWSTMEVEGTTYYEGTMRVGGENQYLRVTPVIDDITGLIVDYDIVFKVGTFTAEADLTSFDGAFYVTDNNNPTFRTRIEENGIFMQKKTGTVWSDVGLVKIDKFNNMIITNDAENLPDIGVIDSTAIIYHFNSGVLDTAGTNLGNITTDGTIKNLPSIVENTNYFEGELSRTLTQTKQLVWNKSPLFNLAGNSIQMSDGLPEPISADYNSKASTAWGLTSAQVSAKLFKVRL